MHRRFARTVARAAITLGLGLATPAHAEPSYTAEDITSWSEAQLATLPHFKHYVPVVPVSAPTSFLPHAHNTAGDIIGTSSYTGWYSELETRCRAATIDQLYPLGDYYWQYIYWDGTDYHFQNGYVRYTRGNDINYAGLSVGESTVTGFGEFAYQYTSTATLYDPFNDNVTDLTPDATRARAIAINNRGEIAGYVEEHPLGTGGFRRSPDGTIQLLDSIGAYRVVPAAINRFGLIVGVANRTPAVSITGGATAPIGIESNYDSAATLDVNDSGWIAGRSWSVNDVVESFATVWEPSGASWTPYDLNEVCQTEDIILERAIAIDELGHLIVRGRPDGTDTPGTRLYFLTPEAPLTPPCTPDIGIHPRPASIDPGQGAAFTVALASGEGVSFRWQHESDPGVFQDLADGPTPSGAVIAGAATNTLTITNAAPADAGAYRAVATNACDEAFSNPATLVVVPPPCAGDLDADYDTDVLDFATFLTSFGTTVTPGEGADFDASGEVDVLDFAIFVTDFGCGG